MSGQTANGGGSGPAFDAGTEWLRGEGIDNDVVLSSRVRLARNLAGFPFVNRASRQERQQVLEAARAPIAALGKDITWINLHKTPVLDRTLLVERHLISKQHAKGLPRQPEKQAPPSPGGEDNPRAVAVSSAGERLSIMVNEEDHLRVQMIRSGFSLDEAWAEIDRIDDALEAGLEYAFSAQLGYLTACATNVGTGMRMSVMLHLPGLRLTGDIEKVKRAASDMNLAVRGFYGEGSDAAGDFYQISNQTTLGKREESILDDLRHVIIPQVVEYERVARRTLHSRRRHALEDAVYRALGLLTHARLLTAEEAMQHLSHVRLGVVMGLIAGMDQKHINTLILLAQPAHLQRVMGKEMDQEQRRIARATMIRSRLTKPAQ